MRASMSYLAGAGTVIVAMGMGLGGGLLMGNIMNPHEVREVGKVEQRAGPQQAQQSPQPASDQNTAAHGPQTQSPYLAAIQQAATAPVVVSPAPANPPQPEANNAAPKPASPATDNKTQSSDASAKPKPVEASTMPQQAPAQQAAHEQQNPAVDNAYAKARDTDLKRSDDTKRDDKRKADRADRRQQWSARRQQQREQELRDVEASVREDTDQPREIIVRRDDSRRDDFRRGDFRRDEADRPMRMEFPRFNLFDQD
jgi:hypothetical protein